MEKPVRQRFSRYVLSLLSPAVADVIGLRRRATARWGANPACTNPPPQTYTENGTPPLLPSTGSLVRWHGATKIAAHVWLRRAAHGPTSSALRPRGFVHAADGCRQINHRVRSAGVVRRSACTIHSAYYLLTPPDSDPALLLCAALGSTVVCCPRVTVRCPRYIRGQV